MKYPGRIGTCGDAEPASNTSFIINKYYAIRSFEYNTLDYLLKPVSPPRLERALKKVYDRQLPAKSPKKGSRLSDHSQIFIKDGDHCWLVRIGDIRLFEIVGNYTRVHFESHTPLLYKSLLQVEEKLPEDAFFRANRQQIVNINFVAEIIPWFNGKLKLRMTDGAEVEVSRRQSSVFRDRMSL